MLHSRLLTLVALLGLPLASLAAQHSGAGLPKSMKQYRLEKAEQGYRLALHEVPVPTPGERQVLIHVRATSLNRRDVLILNGNYGPGDSTGRVPLSDGAGEVAAVGTHVTRVRVGDHVAAIFFQSWLSGHPNATTANSALGGAIDGMLSEYVVLPEDGVVRVPGHLSFAEAATLPCAGVTAWNGLFTRGHVQAGDIVLLEGTGGVSIFGLQLAVSVKAKPIITSSSDAKLARARELGAWQTINYRTTPEWDKAVMQLTEGHGADQVLEVGGQDTLPKAVGSLAFGGHMANIGGLTGWDGQIPFALLALRNAQASGIYVGSRADFEALNAWIAKHHIKPAVDREFEFADADDAYQYMDSGSLFGKVVIKLP